MLKCTGNHIIQTKVGDKMNIVRFALPMVGNDELGYRNVEGARSGDVNFGKCHPIACPDRVDTGHVRSSGSVRSDMNCSVLTRSVSCFKSVWKCTL